MITAANFSAYVKEHGAHSDLFYFVHMVDSAGNNYYFSDYKTQLDSYLPSANLTVSPIKYQTNIRDGIYSISPVIVRIDNTAQPTTTGTKRFTENFSSGEFETELCTIYLGYDGCTSSDFLPYYKGRMVEFRIDAIGCEFSVVDRTIFELPLIPKNKFSRSSYPEIAEGFIGNPIPLLYGSYSGFNTNPTYNKVRPLVPAYLVKDEISESTPKLTLEIADNPVYSLGNLYVWDDSLNTALVVDDTKTKTTSTARYELELKTADNSYFMQCQGTIYPDKVFHTGATNPENAIDGVTGTDATFTNVTSSVEIIAGFPAEISALPEEDVTPILSNPAVETGAGIWDVQVSIAGRDADTYVSGDVLTVSAENTNWSVDLDETVVNLLTSNYPTYHITSDYLNVNTGLVYSAGASNRALFYIEEADDGSGTNATGNVTLIPDDGVYPTMSSACAEAERQAGQHEADGNLTNLYSVTYDKAQNKVLVKILSGTKYFRVVYSASNNWASKFGFTTTTGWANDEHESDGFCTTDIPDGDLSYLKIKVTSNTTKVVELASISVSFDRGYRAFNVASGDTIGGRRSTSGGRRRGIGRLPQQEEDRRRGTRIVGRDTRYQLNDFTNARSVLNNVAGSRFFAQATGQPNSGSTDYEKRAGAIMLSVLEDHLSVSSGDIDSTSLTDLNTNTSDKEYAFYLSDEISVPALFGQMCSFSKSFYFLSQEGKHKVASIKSSYSSSDTDFTIHYRDIPGNLRDSIKFKRNSIDDVAKEIDFYYALDPSEGKHSGLIEKTLTSDLNITAKTISCDYITDTVTAGLVSEDLSGTGSTPGFFGRQRNMCQITTMDHDLQRAELGDICQFHEDWDSVIDVFGNTPSNVFWMVTGKQYDKNRITFTLTEVYIQGLGPNGEWLPDEAAGDTMIFLDWGRIADEGFTASDFFPDYPTSLTLGTVDNASTSSEWAKGSNNTIIDGGDSGGPLSGLDDSGVGSGAGAVVYNNSNANSVHAYTSPGSDAFYVEIWLKDGERVSASDGSMYLGAPFTTAGSGAKWYIGIDLNNKVNFHLTDGTTSVDLVGSTTLTTPFTGQIFAYYNPGTTCVVGFNGASDGSTTPSASIGSIFGGTTFANRMHVGATNVPASYTTAFEGIINRFYAYRIGTSRFPSDAATTIALHNYNKLNGNF